MATNDTDADETGEQSDGATVRVADTTVTAEAAAGHAVGERLFSYDQGGKRAIVGDHVLGTITPNPFLQPPESEDDERPRVLPAFNDSLDRLREESYDQFLPGHGDRITDPAARIDTIRDAHERRTANVRELLDGPATPAEVMRGLFDDLPATEQFAGMSEALGHLDVLEARGEVVHSETGEHLTYERSD